MAIEFSCSNCKTNLKAQDNMAGTECKCPTCKRPITVPAQSGKDNESNTSTKAKGE